MKISLKNVSFYGFEANRLIHTLYFCSVKHIPLTFQWTFISDIATNIEHLFTRRAR